MFRLSHHLLPENLQPEMLRMPLALTTKRCLSLKFIETDVSEVLSNHTVETPAMHCEGKNKIYYSFIFLFVLH